ncbi:MAG TPA: MATE family efflux transporter [Clostridiales bacterium]|nr:MAG: Multidrug export protein MepA [Firmicutes bacterium ADurb.Bin262]HOU09108.1 MATE family efflux transporter [Clostridiales bacterium]
MLTHLKRDKGFYRQLGSLAAPVMLQNLLNNSLAMVGTFMLGMLGETEIAAATLAGTPFFVLQLLVFGFQSGASVLFSQYWGKKDLKAVNRILGIGLYFCAALTFLFSLVCFLFAGKIAGLISNDAETVRLAAQFMRITAFSYVLNAMSIVYLSAQRSIGRPKVGLFILTNTMAMDTLLSYILIFGKLGLPAMGIRGAAWAMAAARVIEFVITLIYAVFFGGRLKLDARCLLRPGRELIGDFIRYSGPVVLNEAVWGLGSSLYSVIYSLMDKSYLAAYTVAGNIEKILSSVNFGFAMAAAIMMGQFIGAGKQREAREAGKTFNVLGLFVGIFISLVLLAGSPLILGAFRLPEATKDVVRLFLLVTIVIMPLRSNLVVNLLGNLRAGGDTRFVFLIDTGYMWFVCLPLAFLFSMVFHLPVFWVILMPALEDVLKEISALKRFFSGKWMTDLTR